MCFEIIRTTNEGKYCCNLSTNERTVIAEDGYEDEFEFRSRSASVSLHPFAVSQNTAISRQRLRTRYHVPAETANNLPTDSKKNIHHFPGNRIADISPAKLANSILSKTRTENTFILHVFLTNRLQPLPSNLVDLTRSNWTLRIEGFYERLEKYIFITRGQTFLIFLSEFCATVNFAPRWINLKKEEREEMSANSCVKLCHSDLTKPRKVCAAEYTRVQTAVSKKFSQHSQTSLHRSQNAVSSIKTRKFKPHKNSKNLHYSTLE